MKPATQPSQLPDEMRVGGTSASAISALVDGELSTAEADALFASSWAEPSAVHASWHHYHLIGDVLRGSTPATVSAQTSQVFLAAIQARLLADLPASSSEPSAIETVKGQHKLAIATRPALDKGRTTAANEGVFRWKMVAGFASLTAVVAVTGSLLYSAPSTQGGQGTGAQIAWVNQPSGEPGKASLEESGSASAGQPQVVVNTPQGPVLRDPQLEALMAQHRQYGDMSALQTPSGFLRNATYDAPSR